MSSSSVDDANEETDKAPTHDIWTSIETDFKLAQKKMFSSRFTHMGIRNNLYYEKKKTFYIVSPTLYHAILSYNEKN